MKKQYIYIYTGLLFLTMCLLPMQSRAQFVVTDDTKDTMEQAKLLAQESKKAMESMKEAQASVMSAINIGNYLDLALSFNFSMPKPEMSSDVVNAVPKASSSDSGDIAGQVKGALPKVGSGDSSKSEKFESKEAVNKSVKDNMQIENASGSESDGDGKGIVDQVVSMATGDGGSGAKTDEITKKRAQLAQSKQAFARYGLAVALVHRTLSYRTIKDTKQATQQKGAETTTTRKTHEGKMYGNMRMAETYNRLLMSQGTANGLSGFSSLDEIEGRIDGNLRGITDGLAGGGIAGGIAGGLGAVSGGLGL